MKIVKVIIINVVILVALLSSVELGFRYFAPPSVNIHGQHWQAFRPFVMFATPQMKGGGSHLDQYRNERVKRDVHSNNEGYWMDEDVSLNVPREKAPNERVIVLSGGSAAWGVGATTYETSIAGRLQSYLNANQDTYDYKVLNLSQGGWIAFQQYIALAEWGTLLNPDWVVTMDATNDAAVTCAHAQGAGYTLYYALMDAYITGYTFKHMNPVFFRGKFENWLIEHSAAYRTVTKSEVINVPLKFEEGNKNPIRRVIRDVNWSDVSKALAFYVRTESMIADLFPKAKILWSTQPLPFDFLNMFGGIYRAETLAQRAASEAQLQLKLDELDKRNQGKPCGLQRWNDARDYFMPVAAMRTERLVTERSGTGQALHYVNAGIVFPDAFEDRKRFFIDPVHMNDDGMDKVAKLYADIILSSDFPKVFEQPGKVSSNTTRE